MKYLSKFLAIFALIVIFSGNLYSQGGNNYTIFGLGDVHHNTSAGFDALAGTSIGYPDQSAINHSNPAMWSGIKKTRLQMGYRFNQHFNNTDGQVLRQNNGKINGISGIFLIDSSLGLSLGFGLLPFTSVNYYVANDFYIEQDGESFHGKTFFQGKGGLNQAYLGGSIDITKDISLGIAGFGTFGLSEYYTETVFYAANVFSSANSTIDSYSGAGFKAGLYYKGIKNFGIGAYYEKHFETSISRELIYLSTFLGDTSFAERAYLRIPDAFGAGISYKTGKFILGSDFAFRDFTGFTYQQPARGKFTSNVHWSAGVSRLGNDRIDADLLDRITYKFGLGYKKLYYQLEGEDISQIYASFGGSVPLPGDAFINGALVFGRRGTSNKGLIEEYFGRFNVEITIGETWFKPFRRGY